MAHDEALARQVRDLLEDEPVEELRMFGGLAFMVAGHMAVVLGEDGLMVRHDPDDPSVLERPHASAARMGGRTRRGFCQVDDAGFASHEALADWVAVGVARARSLPPKG